MSRPSFASDRRYASSCACSASICRIFSACCIWSICTSCWNLARGELLHLGRPHLVVLQLHVLHGLRLLRGAALQLQLRTRLDRLVVHALQLRRGLVAAEDDLVDLVADPGGAVGEHGESGEVVERLGAVGEVLEGVVRGKVNDVGAAGVDEVANRVVRVVEHLLHRLRVVEDHQLHAQLRVVRGADVRDVVVELVGRVGEGRGCECE